MSAPVAERLGGGPAGKELAKFSWAEETEARNRLAGSEITDNGEDDGIDDAEIIAVNETPGGRHRAEIVQPQELFARPTGESTSTESEGSLFTDHASAEGVQYEPTPIVPGLNDRNDRIGAFRAGAATAREDIARGHEATAAATRAEEAINRQPLFDNTPPEGDEIFVGRSQRPWPREAEWQTIARNQMDAEQAGGRHRRPDTENRHRRGGEGTHSVADLIGREQAEARQNQDEAYDSYQENITTTARREAMDNLHGDALQMNERFDRRTARREARRALGRRIIAAVNNAARQSAELGSDIAGQMAAGAQERAARRADIRQENEAINRQKAENKQAERQQRAEAKQAERDAAAMRELGELHFRERRRAREAAVEAAEKRHIAAQKRARAEARKAYRTQVVSEAKATGREVVDSVKNRIRTSKIGRVASALRFGAKAAKSATKAHYRSTAPTGRHHA
ncbi:hypothetical protein JNJ66_05545 [Candidatus Saccharibacteria bacterium]|nr:hypothetical protein [Candidatus Saccharibacteria bacterium]